jgi:predicted SprT family Zn-dependent metalloprotease
MDLVKLRGVASQLLYRHRLIGWTFDFANTGRRLGVCKHRLSRIEIARHYAEHSPEANVMDTLLHEIAHAVVGPGHGHDAVWKKKAIELGATPRACSTDDDNVVKAGNWQAHCLGCSKLYNRYKQPAVLSGYRCGIPTCKKPLTPYQFTGDPALKPKAQPRVVWQAICGGCKHVHIKNRQPKRGTWHCLLCSGRHVLKWQRAIQTPSMA